MNIYSEENAKSRVSSSNRSFSSFISTLISKRENSVLEIKGRIGFLNKLDIDKQKELVKKRIIFNTISFCFCFGLVCLVYLLASDIPNGLQVFSVPYFIIICLVLLYFRFHNISKELYRFSPNQQITREEEFLGEIEAELEDLRILQSDFTSLKREFNNLLKTIEMNNLVAIIKDNKDNS